MMNNYEIIQAAKAAVIDAIENTDAAAAMKSAERALALLTFYLQEGDYAKH